MSATSVSEIADSLKTGIAPGPTRIASPTVRGSLSAREGADTPPPIASPPPDGPWHAAQLAV